MEERWQDINIDVGEYKDKYYKIKSTEELFQVISNSKRRKVSYAVHELRNSLDCRSRIRGSASISSVKQGWVLHYYLAFSIKTLHSFVLMDALKPGTVGVPQQGGSVPQQ